MRELTDKQKDVLIFLYRHYIEWHCLPTCQVIADNFEWSSANAAYEHLTRLVKAGYLERTIRGHRFKV